MYLSIYLFIYLSILFWFKIKFVYKHKIKPEPASTIFKWMQNQNSADFTESAVFSNKRIACFELEIYGSVSAFIRL